MRSLRSIPRLSALLVALGLVASACGSSDTAEASAGDVSDETGAEATADAAEDASAPIAANITTVTSETFDLATYTGEDTLFWFWAPW